jgi:hypothetical protein
MNTIRATPVTPYVSKPSAVACVVARAVGDHARVAGVVFVDLEDDLHQVGADVGDFREDAAGDPQCGRTERFTDGEADEARPGKLARHKQQNRQHDRQLDRDQQRADADAGLQRNRIDRVGLAAQAGKRTARVGIGIDANAEPRHAVAAGDADQAEEHDDADFQRRVGHPRLFLA